jgi:hypothetical protein
MAKHRCTFCRDAARSLFDDLPVCRWHLIVIYLSLHLNWSD